MIANNVASTALTTSATSVIHLISNDEWPEDVNFNASTKYFFVYLSMGFAFLTIIAVRVRESERGVRYSNRTFCQSSREGIVSEENRPITFSSRSPKARDIESNFRPGH